MSIQCVFGLNTPLSRFSIGSVHKLNCDYNGSDAILNIRPVKYMGTYVVAHTSCVALKYCMHMFIFPPCDATHANAPFHNRNLLGEIEEMQHSGGVKKFVSNLTYTQ